MPIWKLKYSGKKNKKHVCNISSNVHFSFQWLCYQNMSYDFVERKKHVSDMATSIKAKILEWKLMSFLIPSYIIITLHFLTSFLH